MLKLYNTLTRKKEEFKSIEKGKVGMYSCGPTVYNYGHIGNYRAFVASDILVRYLEYLGYKVKKIVNITDVDDKTIAGSIKEKKSLSEFTRKYEKAFFEDERTLNMRKADKYPRATQHIKEMLALVELLLKKGYAYKANDGIYFNIKKFKDYGKLSKVKLGKLKAGARVNKDEYDKENVQDFALWKYYTGSDGKVFWNTNMGKGRPGWHIECSVMSTKYLGQPFDIHTGGIDLVFPHHENEIAQSEAGNNKKFVNYWLHNEWILVNGEKMSKSKGNFFTLRDVIDKGYSPMALRYFYLTGHYRSQLNFTFESLNSNQNSYERLKNIIGEIKDSEKSKYFLTHKNSKEFLDDKKINKNYLKEFEAALDDDLNTPEALQVLWKILRDEKAEGKLRTIKKMDEVLGLDLLKKEKLEIPASIKKLVEQREKARKARNFKLADEIREKIKKEGWQVDDTEQGARLRKL